MGLLLASLRKQYLISYKNELENKISLVQEAKMNLTKAGKDLTPPGTDLDPDNPVVKELNQRKERLNALEQKLDAQLNEYQEDLKMIEPQIQACDKMFDDSVKDTFKAA
jgi:DNA repair ATPase RecN